MTPPCVCQHVLIKYEKATQNYQKKKNKIGRKTKGTGTQARARGNNEPKPNQTKLKRNEIK